MASRDYVFTDEALRAQDEKTVPLTIEPEGPVIGEATMKYDPKTGDLNADIRIDDPKLADVLNGPIPIFKKERQDG